MKTQLGSHELFVAIDIGTTKICVLVAQRIDSENLDIIGIGKAPSHGVARGVVVDIAQAVHSIKLAIREAELMAGCKIESVAVGISGSHIQALNSHGIVPIKHERVKDIDVTAVLAAAKAVVIPEGHQVLHAVPQYYIIDSQQQIMDPIGMFGVRLEAHVHIITGSISSVQNLVRCCQLAGVKVTDVILEPLASAEAVLSNDEKELGVGILDIGGGTSDFAIYQQGTIRYTKVFGIAGNHVTQDIALCLRTTIKDAERIKQQYGASQQDIIDLRATFEVEMVHGSEVRRISVFDLVSVIEPRITELFYMVQQDMTQQYLKHLMPAGLVLTGGGSLLHGMANTGYQMLNLPVRVGNPHVPAMFKESLDSPIYATGYGLLLYMLKKNKMAAIDHMTGPLVGRILWRMKSWISDFL